MCLTLRFKEARVLHRAISWLLPVLQRPSRNKLQATKR